MDDDVSADRPSSEAGDDGPSAVNLSTTPCLASKRSLVYVLVSCFVICLCQAVCHPRQSLVEDALEGPPRTGKLRR